MTLRTSRPVLCWASLSAPRRRLLNLIQDIHFGRILELRVRQGEPLFDPAPQVIHTFKLGKDEPEPPVLKTDNTQLKKQVVDLFRTLDRLQNGTVLSLQVAAGLPFVVDVAVDPAC